MPRLVGLLAAISISASLAAYGETPSLDEATKWIKTKLDGAVVTYNADDGGYVRYSYDSVNFQGCTFTVAGVVTVHTHMNNPPDIHTVHAWRSSVSLGDVRSVEIITARGGDAKADGDLRLHASPQSVNTQMDQNAGYEDSLSIYLKAPSLAQRMKNAFQNAIKSCAGKEPF